MVMPYFFSQISPEIIVMGALFLIFLTFLNYVLSKVFRDKYGNVNKATAGVIAFSMSVLIIYFGRNIFSNIIEGLRLSNTILYILSAVIIIGLIYLFRKRLKVCVILMIVGAGLILIGGFTDWFYQKWFVILIGVASLLIGIKLCSKKKFSNYIEDKAIMQYPQNIEKIQRQTRERTARELRKKYKHYLRLVQDIQRKNKGKIPKLDTKEGHLRHRYIQAMKAIEELAREKGIRL